MWAGDVKGVFIYICGRDWQKEIACGSEIPVDALSHEDFWVGRVEDGAKSPDREDAVSGGGDAPCFRSGVEIEISGISLDGKHVVRGVTDRKWGCSPSAWYVTLLAENPKRSTLMRTWLGGQSTGFGDRTIRGPCPEKGRGTQRERFSIGSVTVGRFAKQCRLAHGVDGVSLLPSMPDNHTLFSSDMKLHIQTAAGTSAGQSRRAKNVAHRADDVGTPSRSHVPHEFAPHYATSEFAFEIGSGLLTEVRRLQNLLGERDKVIRDMQEEKDSMEKNLRAALRQQEQSTGRFLSASFLTFGVHLQKSIVDKYKEENWNLEVTLQELRTQFGNSQSATQRLESEHKRLTRLLSTARDAGDQHKNESERLANIIEEMKAKYETDVPQACGRAAGLARDETDLQTIDTSNKEATRTDRRFPRFGSPLTPNGAGGSNFASTPAVGEDGTLNIFTGGASINRRKHDVNAVFGAPEEFADYLDSPEAYDFVHDCWREEHGQTGVTMDERAPPLVEFSLDEMDGWQEVA